MTDETTALAALLEAADRIEQSPKGTQDWRDGYAAGIRAAVMEIAAGVRVAPSPTESGHDIRCVDCGQQIGPGMVPCLTPGAGLYDDRPITKVTTPDGQVYRAHVPCCWCREHHEEGE